VVYHDSKVRRSRHVTVDCRPKVDRRDESWQLFEQLTFEEEASKRAENVDICESIDGRLDEPKITYRFKLVPELFGNETAVVKVANDRPTQCHVGITIAARASFLLTIRSSSQHVTLSVGIPNRHRRTRFDRY